MYPVFQELIHQAESEYLNSNEIELLKGEVSTFKQRIHLYKTIRDKEISMFQEIADQLVLDMSEKDPRNIENCLRQWLLIMRYCAMAMLINNPEFLERRLLEWLIDIVEVEETQAISNSLYSLLMGKLNKLVSDQQVTYIEPFLSQAKEYLEMTAAVK
jgi:Phycobilisome protein